uniref:Lipid-binding serum glycoprotein N-terminal domain-containing protein n=1 Tax=Homalodisca liturata TaxID=320908 RepID=A0A1B6I648_9HEMI
MSDITGTLWFLLLTVAVRADIYSFNEEMDGFLNQFTEDIRLAQNSQVPLPNVHAQYFKQVLFLNFYTEVNCTNGTFQDMTSIRRAGNTTMVTAKEYFLFRTEFGFDDLRIGYNYQARFMGIPFFGTLDLVVENNSIYLELLVNLTSDRCSGNVVTIRNMKITALNNIMFNVTGFSIINPLMSRLLTYSFTNVSVGVKASIEEALMEFFKSNLREFDFCKFGTVPENIPFDDMESSEEFVLPNGVNVNVSNDISFNTILS